MKRMFVFGFHPVLVWRPEKTIHCHGCKTGLYIHAYVHTYIHTYIIYIYIYILCFGLHPALVCPIQYKIPLKYLHVAAQLLF